MSKYMDALEDVSDVSSSDSEAEQEAAEDKAPSKKRKAGAPDLEELQKVGFTSGPSVLAVPEPQGLNSWEWCVHGVENKTSLPTLLRSLKSQKQSMHICGRGHGSQRAELGEEETFEEREQTRQAATSGAEEAVLRALQQKAEVHHGVDCEYICAARHRLLSFEQALQRRDEERAEHQKRQQDRRKTYQQRVCC